MKLSSQPGLFGARLWAVWDTPLATIVPKSWGACMSLNVLLAENHLRRMTVPCREGPRQLHAWYDRYGSAQVCCHIAMHALVCAQTHTCMSMHVPCRREARICLQAVGSASAGPPQHPRCIPEPLSDPGDRRRGAPAPPPCPSSHKFGPWHQSRRRPAAAVAAGGGGSGGRRGGVRWHCGRHGRHGTAHALRPGYRRWHHWPAHAA